MANFLQNIYLNHGNMQTCPFTTGKGTQYYSESNRAKVSEGPSLDRLLHSRGNKGEINEP